MAGRHQEFLERMTARQRLIIGVGVVIWLFVLVGLIAFLHEDRKAPLADPQPPIFPGFSAPPVPVLPAPTTAGVPSSVSATPATTEPSRVTTAPRPPRRTTAAPPPPNFTARYVVTNNQANSFQVGILLTNNGSVAQGWQLRVAHDPAAGVRFGLGFGASVTRSGDTTVLSGGPLAAGRTVTIGFQVSKQVRGVVVPTSCVVGGRNCIVTVQ